MAARVLFIDLEMAPMKGYFWQLWDQNIPLNMVCEHTSMLAWAASWDGEDKIYYDDVSKQRNRRDDKRISKSLQKLINKADIIVAHALDRFDRKKSNYRFIVNGLKPTSQTRTIDTLKIAKKHFAFDSNKLEHLAEILKVKVTKYKHSKFPGNELFIQCLEGNKEAWKEMRIYNPMDITVLKAVYKALIPWDSSINFSSYNEINTCACGCKVFTKDGIRNTDYGRFQKWRCKNCGRPHKSTINLFSKERKAELRHGG